MCSLISRLLFEDDGHDVAEYAAHIGCDSAPYIQHHSSSPQARMIVLLPQQPTSWAFVPQSKQQTVAQ
jgi:hypothetical protein